jgi:hypothetical protein
MWQGVIQKRILGHLKMTIARDYTGFIMETRPNGMICARVFRDGTELGDFEAPGKFASLYATQFLECAKISQEAASIQSSGGHAMDHTWVTVAPSNLAIVPSRSFGCLELTMTFGEARIATPIGPAAMLQLCRAIVSLCGMPSNTVQSR